MGAAGREEVLVVGLAVRVAVALKEVTGAQLVRAVNAREVLRVPDLTQSRDHLQRTRTSRHLQDVFAMVTKPSVCVLMIQNIISNTCYQWGELLWQLQAFHYNAESFQ